MRIVAEPLTAEAFKPFGAVLEGPPVPGRVYLSDTLANGRAHAPVSLSVATVEPKATFPDGGHGPGAPRALLADLRPLHVSRYLVLATLDAPGGGRPLPAARLWPAPVRASLRHGRGTTRSIRCWTGRPRSRSSWRDGTAGDEEFVPVTTPLTIVLPEEPVMTTAAPRDLVGYAGNPPHPKSGRAGRGSRSTSS
jgi:hypothetical protein